MANLRSKDDRIAVLRRLERHGNANTRESEPRELAVPKPALSGRVVVTVLSVFALIALTIWSPWSSNAGRVEVPVPAESEAQELGDGELERAGAAELHTGAPRDQAPPLPGPGETPPPVFVNVVGHVRNPGLHSLPPGSRVADAIEAAGGPTEQADITRLNLARKLQDEEYLAVLATDEEPPQILAPAVGSSLGGEVETNARGVEELGDARGDERADVLNLNTATEEQLMQLPGVGPVLAERISAWRAQNDGFRHVDELREVAGVGPKIFAQLEPLVTV